MQLPTVKIREKATGRIKIVNQTKYGDNLAAFSGWEIVSMRRGSAPDQAIAIEREQERIETIRANNPKSPAYADPQRAFEARSGVTTNVTAVATEESPFATELTTAVVETAPDSVEEETREVPVIGGSQMVKVRGRKPIIKQKNGEGDIL